MILFNLINFTAIDGPPNEFFSAESSIWNLHVKKNDADRPKSFLYWCHKNDSKPDSVLKYDFLCLLVKSDR